MTQKYKVVEELADGSPVGAQAVDNIVEISDQAAADALVASGHIVAVEDAEDEVAAAPEKKEDEVVEDKELGNGTGNVSTISMRAKMTINNVVENGGTEALTFVAVGPNAAYPDDGADENNTYAKFSPAGKLELTVANPALIGQFKVGDTFYLDFTKAE